MFAVRGAGGIVSNFNDIVIEGLWYVPDLMRIALERGVPCQQLVQTPSHEVISQRENCGVRGRWGQVRT